MATYTVQEGDTLSAVAESHGLALDELLRMNPQIADPDLIHPGDEVIVSEDAPASEEAPANQQPALEETAEAVAAEAPPTTESAPAAPREVYGAREAI